MTKEEASDCLDRLVGSRIHVESADDGPAVLELRAPARAGAIASGVIALAAFTAGIPLFVVSLHKRKALRVTASPALGPRGVSFSVAGSF